MVVVLARVVEQARILSEGALDDVLERFSFPLGPFDEVIGRIDVGEVVFVVMIFQRFTRHVGRERVVLIGKIGQRERHRLTPK